MNIDKNKLYKDEYINDLQRNKNQLETAIKIFSNSMDKVLKEYGEVMKIYMKKYQECVNMLSNSIQSVLSLYVVLQHEETGELLCITKEDYLKNKETKYKRYFEVLERIEI